MVSLIEANVSLVLQIAVLALVLIAILLKNRKKYRQHGTIMASAIVLHLVTVAIVMGPTFGMIFTTPAIVIDVTVVLTLAHVVLGSIAVVLGIWLVASWHFKTDLKNCFSKKKIMRPTFILWVVAVLLGIAMYVIFWTSFLF